jgi:hypothetical protein
MKISQVLLKEVVATTTSDPVDVSLATKLAIQLIASSITSGNGKFEVEVSNDGGVTWSAYKRLISNIANADTKNDTKVDSVTLNSNTSDMVYFPVGDYIGLIRAKVTRTTDGKYSAIILGV